MIVILILIVILIPTKLMKYLKSFVRCEKEEWTGNLFRRPQCNGWKIHLCW